jgi:multicomponent Na+:H+ antiporter subunit E
VRVAFRAGLLVALWLLAWGELSAANLVSGVAVAVALLLAFPLAPTPDRPIRPNVLGIARLAWYVATQLVTSNVVVAREIVRRRPAVTQGVLQHRLETAGDELVITMMTSIIALSPGTMTVDVDRDAAVLYIHFLLLTDVDAARAGLIRLERLVRGAVSPRPRRAAAVPGR